MTDAAVGWRRAPTARPPNFKSHTIEDNLKEHFLFKHFLAIDSCSGPNSRLQARGSVDEFSRSLIFVSDDGSEAVPGC